MLTSQNVLIILFIAAIVDAVIPIPFTTLFLIYVVITRPPWFMEFVRHLYKQ